MNHTSILSRAIDNYFGTLAFRIMDKYRQQATLVSARGSKGFRVEERFKSTASVAKSWPQQDDAIITGRNSFNRQHAFKTSEVFLNHSIATSRKCTRLFILLAIFYTLLSSCVVHNVHADYDLGRLTQTASLSHRHRPDRFKSDANRSLFGRRTNVDSPILAQQIELLRNGNDQNSVVGQKPRRQLKEKRKRTLEPNQVDRLNTRARISEPLLSTTSESDAFKSRNLWTLVADEASERRNRWGDENSDLLLEDIDDDLLNDDEDGGDDDIGDDDGDGDEDECNEMRAVEEESNLVNDENLFLGQKRRKNTDSSAHKHSSLYRRQGDKLYDEQLAKDLIHHRRQRKQSDGKAKQQTPYKMPYVDQHQQLPIVVSISDNSFVSASPIPSYNGDSLRPDANEIDSDKEDQEQNHNSFESIVSTTATTTSSDSDSSSNLSSQYTVANTSSNNNSAQIAYTQSPAASNLRTRSNDITPNAQQQLDSESELSNRNRGFYPTYHINELAAETKASNKVADFQQPSTRLTATETGASANRLRSSSMQDQHKSRSRENFSAQIEGRVSAHGKHTKSGNYKNNEQTTRDDARSSIAYAKDTQQRDDFITKVTNTDAISMTSNDPDSARSDALQSEKQATMFGSPSTDSKRIAYELGDGLGAPMIVLREQEVDDDASSMNGEFVVERVHQADPIGPHYSNIVRSPNNELANDRLIMQRQTWLAHHPHKASIKIRQEEPYELHHGGFNSALIAILFGIGATGMLVLIVGHKMRSIRRRVAYRGRRRSLVPATDFLINTIPI